MAVSNTTTLVQYVGNNSAVTPYVITFPFDETAWIKCQLLDANGDISDLVLDTDFTVTGAGGATGNLTTAIAYDNTHQLTIYRVVPLTQALDLVYNDRLPAQLLEDALDKLTYVTQQLSTLGDPGQKTLKFPISEPTGNDDTLPVPADRLAKVIYFNATTGALELVTATELALTLDPTLETLVEGKQNVPDIKTANFTAANNEVYIVTASATVTDPTPVQGEGYTVFVRNGSATVNSVAYATAGTIIRRVYHSGTWTSYVYLNKAQLDTTYATFAQGALADSALQDGDAITLGTEVAISGTSVDFASLPSWVKRITLMISAVSLNTANDNLRVQIGDSGGIEATNYFGGAAQATSGAATNVTNGTINGADTIHTAATAGSAWRGRVVIEKLDSITWLITGGLINTTAALSHTSLAYVKSLSGTLDRVRLTTVTGTSAFDAGSINILYE